MRLAAIALSVAMLLGGCATSLYGTATGACIALESVIVKRKSTREQDAQDIASLRAACDSILSRIEDDASEEASQ